MKFTGIAVSRQHSAKLMVKLSSYVSFSATNAIARIALTLLVISLLSSFTLADTIKKGEEIEEVQITLELKNESLAQAFKKIESKTPFHFMYRDENIKNIRNLSIPSSKRSVAAFLKTILAKTPLTFKQVDQRILIIEKANEKKNLEAGVEHLLKAIKDVPVKGKVTDTQGEALIGVSVVAKGTTIGATTDLNGNYSLNIADPNGALVFSYLGYVKQEVAVNNRSVVNVQLIENTTSLEEVVVVGYGTQKRKDLTGSVSSVSEKDFADMPVARLDQALAGKVAGLDILSSGGRPGDESTMLLRGKRSFTASNDPLIILDGMPYYGSMTDINPYDVKSIDVLKDASSAAIYGSRGANGVIIITSKRGITSSPKFMVESYGGPQLRYGRLPYADAQQYAEWGREAFRAQPGGYPFPTTSAEQDAIIFDAIELQTVNSGGKGLDYQDLLLQNGSIQKHQLTVTGGSETVKYNVSGNFFEQEGLLPGDVFNRMSLRSNLDFTLSKSVTAGASIQLNHTKNKLITNPSALSYAFNGNPLGQVYEEDGVTPRFALTTDGFEINPLADYEWDSYRNDRKRWAAFINTYAEAKILPSLTYRLSLGTNFKLGTTKESAGYYSITRNLGLPVANIANSVDNFKLYESTLTFNKVINNDHQFTVTGINGYQSTRTELSGAGVSDLPYEDSRYHNIGSANLVSAVNSNLSEWDLISFAGRFFYGYKSKYLLTLSMRADGATQFAPGHKWGYFPSVAAAYRITEEKFMEGSADWLSDLKLRLSYGVTGNQAINPYQTQGSLGRTTYSWGENAGFGYRPLALSNKDLKWESTSVYNLGIDFGLLNNRISGNIELYDTDTYDLLMFRKLPITSGYDEVLENIGSTNNRGFELGLRTVNIDNPNFKWNSNVSLYSNHTRITELYNGKNDDIGNGWFIGQPINVYYDYQKTGIWQTNEEAQAASFGRQVGQIKLQDLNNDGKYSADDRMILGDSEPDFVGSLTNQFSYKKWDFSFTSYIRWGGMTSVGAFAPFAKKRYNKFIFDYWTPNNPTNAYPRPNQLYEGSGLDGSTLTYRDASLISIPQLSLGYTFPETWLSKVKLTNARVYFSGENMFYWTASEMRKFNMKPDWSGDAQAYPATRTFVMGLNIGF